MRSNSVTITFILLLLSTSLFAQKGGSSLSYEDEDYYLFPINPGERGSLSGTMGELRSTHFHTGIDIRTGAKIGIPVKAAASGDIVRISVNPYGYGNALYILHPNGTHTVYAHLNNFEGELAEYVRAQQYKRGKWDLNLFPKRGQFTVNKGDIIALSGNSGSSGGPHLHFDLRDANHDLLNPLAYGFEEIWDTTPPKARMLAVTPLESYTRINDEFKRQEYKISKRGDEYYVDKPIDVFGPVGLELWAYDLLDGSGFRTGITEMDVYLDDELIHKQTINTFSFSDQRNILVHMPYEELRNTGRRYHKLYIDDGNKLNIYKSNYHKLNFSEDSCLYPVKIVMKDTYNNESTVNVMLRCKRPVFDVQSSSYGHIKEPEATLIDNTLKLIVPVSPDDVANNIMIYKNGEGKELNPSYEAGSNVVYLYDLRNGIPDSVDYCDEKKENFNFKAMVPSSREYHYYNDHLNIDFPYQSLFDTLYLKTDHVELNDKEYFSFGNVNQPLRKRLTVKLKPEQTYDRDKYAVYSVDDAQNLNYQGGDWTDDGIVFKTRNFGTYTIAKDEEPPKVRPIKLAHDDLKFKIYDTQSGIDDYELTINGEWVLMHYDYKRNLIWSERKDENHTYKGDLKLTVTDNQGNERVYTYSLD